MKEGLLTIIHKAKDVPIVRDMKVGGRICSAVFISNDELALGMDTGTIRVLRISDRQFIHSIPVHDAAVTCLICEPRSSNLISGSVDESICVLDRKSFDVVSRLKGHRGTISAVSKIAETEYLLSASEDHTLKIWHSSSGRCLRTIPCREDEVARLAVDQRGKSFVTGGEKGSLKVWSIDTGWFEMNFLEPAICRPKTFKELAGMHKAFTSALNDFSREWRNGETADALKSFDRVRNLSGFSWSKESILVRNTVSKVTKRLELKAGFFIRSLRGHKGEITSLAATLDNLFLLTGSSDGTAIMWDVVTGKSVRKYDTGSPIVHVFSMPRNMGILTFSKDNCIRLWDGEGKLTTEFFDICEPIKICDAAARAIALNLNGEPVSVNLESGDSEVLGPALIGGKIMCFSEDGETAYGCKSDRLIQRRNISTSRITSVFRDLGQNITAIRPFINNETVVAGTQNGELALYMGGSGMNIASMKGHSEAVLSLASMEDEMWASGSGDNSIRLWDWSAEKCLIVLEGHLAAVTSVMFFKNGFMLASGSSDGSTRLWGLEWNLKMV
jgi:WD40 repeat protein